MLWAFGLRNACLVVLALPGPPSPRTISHGPQELQSLASFSPWILSVSVLIPESLPVLWLEPGV